MFRLDNCFEVSAVKSIFTPQALVLRRKVGLYHRDFASGFVTLTKASNTFPGAQNFQAHVPILRHTETDRHPVAKQLSLWLEYFLEKRFLTYIPPCWTELQNKLFRDTGVYQH